MLGPLRRAKRKLKRTGLVYRRVGATISMYRSSSGKLIQFLCERKGITRKYQAGAREWEPQP